jgi:predicted phosphodiesterase
MASNETNQQDDRPLVAISDVHGHLKQLKLAFEKIFELTGREDCIVVLLGDYCDNGPDVPELIEYLIEIQKNPPYQFELHMIAGNHDLCNILAYNNNEFNYSGRKNWWEERIRFYNPGFGTTHLYEAYTREQFQSKMPTEHYEFLVNLPWYVKIDNYVFVHAGLRQASETSVEEQLEFLDRKDLSNLEGHCYKDRSSHGSYGLPDQIVNKDWCKMNDPNWEVIVVTGHNKYAVKDRKDFVRSHRIGFHSCVDLSTQYGINSSLHCGILPRYVTEINQEIKNQIQFFNIKAKRAEPKYYY